MWIQFTQQDIIDRLNDDERYAYEEAGDENPFIKKLPGIIAQVTGLVRGKVLSNTQNAAGPTGTIPQETLWAASTIVRHSLIATQPTATGDTDYRNEELRRAYDYLDRIADGKDRIEDPEGEVPGYSNGFLAGGKCLLDF